MEPVWWRKNSRVKTLNKKEVIPGFRVTIWYEIDDGRRRAYNIVQYKVIRK